MERGKRTGPTGLPVVLCVLLGLALWSGSPAASAQTPDPSLSASSTPAAPPPAHLAGIDGSVSVEREGLVDAATANAPLLEGDRIHTADGRAEIVLADGSLLHLDRETTLDVLSASLLRVPAGRVFLIVTGAAGGNSPYRIDGPGASVQIESPGEYRIAVIDDGTRGTQVELAVARGWAQIFNDRGATPVTAGERSVVVGDAAPGPVHAHNAAGFDTFDRWSGARRAERTGSASGRYLPSDLYAYAGTFERHGRWANHTPYGWVWYPRVTAGWRPYHHGGWSPYRGGGLAWVGWDPWDWPTHHYGSWGISLSGGWFWIPGREWSPAWVSWATAPDYLAWCPLGYDGRPVIGLGFSAGYAGSSWRDPWFAWNVTPRASFAYGIPVQRYAIAGRTLPYRARSTFVVHNRHAGRAPGWPPPYGGGGQRADRQGRAAVPRAQAAPRAADRAARLPGSARLDGRPRADIPATRPPQSGLAPSTGPGSRGSRGQSGQSARPTPGDPPGRAVPRGGASPAPGADTPGWNGRRPRPPSVGRPDSSSPGLPPATAGPSRRRSSTPPPSVGRPTAPSSAGGTAPEPRRRAAPRDRAPGAASPGAAPAGSRPSHDRASDSSGQGRVAGRRAPR